MNVNKVAHPLIEVRDVKLRRKHVRREWWERARRETMAERGEAHLPGNASDQACIHFQLNPELFHRTGRQQYDEMGAVSQPLVDLPAQAVAGADLPIRAHQVSMPLAISPRATFSAISLSSNE